MRNNARLLVVLYNENKAITTYTLDSSVLPAWSLYLVMKLKARWWGGGVPHSSKSKMRFRIISKRLNFL